VRHLQWRLVRMEGLPVVDGAKPYRKIGIRQQINQYEIGEAVRSRRRSRPFSCCNVLTNKGVSDVPRRVIEPRL